MLSSMLSQGVIAHSQGEGLPDATGPTARLIFSADGSLLKTQAVPPFNSAEAPGPDTINLPQNPAFKILVDCRSSLWRHHAETMCTCATKYDAKMLKHAAFVSCHIWGTICEWGRVVPFVNMHACTGQYFDLMMM